MSTVITGAATSYDLPNFLGELFQRSEKPNAFLRLVGGLSGGVRTVTTHLFPMGVDYVLPAAVSTGVVEGAAPTMREQSVGQSTNILQIFQEGVELTYSNQGASGTMSGVAAIPGAANGNGALVSPRSIEWQRQMAVMRIARNANLAFLRGTYQAPANNATARQTRGVRTAITTNVFANAGTPRALTKTIFENALRDMVVNSAFNIGDELVALCDGTQYGNLAAIYEVNPDLNPGSTVAGVMVQRVFTRWGPVSLVYEPDMNAGEILILQPQYCRVVGMEIPAKGILFAEPIAKTGSADREQIYGEMGIDYRHEIYHGRVSDLAV